MKKTFREAFVFLVNKYRNEDNPVGDFCRDSLDFLYKEEMEDPKKLMNFIANEIDLCDEAVEAMNELIREYNRIVDRQEMRIVDDYGDGESKHYAYEWETELFDKEKYPSEKERDLRYKEISDYMCSIPKKYSGNTLRK